MKFNISLDDPGAIAVIVFTVILALYEIILYRIEKKQKGKQQ